MALVPYPNVISSFASGLSSMGEAVSYITDTYIGGDLLITNLAQVCEGYRAVKEAEGPIRAKAAGGTADQSYILDQLQGLNIDGLTLGQVGTALTSLDTAMTDWVTALNPFLQANAAPVFGFASSTRPGRFGGTYTFPQLQYPVSLPEAQGLIVKNAAQTAALRAALVTLSAIEV